MTEPRSQEFTLAKDSDHISVMLREVLAALAPQDGETYSDGTLGAGGYSRAILESADCRVVAIDRDVSAIKAGRELAARFNGKLLIVEGCFGEMDSLLRDEGIEQVDGVVLDLGVSSMQLDQAERGFSFRQDADLDMRMEGTQESDRPSAADVINSLSEGELADIIFHLGEERRARQVARAIVNARRNGRIERTGELADIVRKVVRPAGRASGKKRDEIDPATRTFQGLRIYVNDELGELHRGLRAAERLLAPGGRLIVVSFHSLEDRAVKRFLVERCGAAPRGSRHLPANADSQSPAATFELLFKGAQGPAEDEIAVNPRSRSARLRAAQRTSAAPWAEEAA
ncbi:16S rRNA (cytosine(1402)-N(4))-methyltransferase RsmH [Pelagibius sp. Alg239-R121]|uniref:16S rRNA (cytosine(1402)-N(4))-methyltransferase RsmH n=1 Tax=Pelagibius sp. Alg239-R121 TaxID=2993448 RepID=UPI002AC333A0|nr:16S rRNA (cytosine(1402)-N(4))-methyltransferase RsmH [Pelagibius sp. Alg239-R121]